MEDLLDAGGQRGDQEPRCRHQRHPDVALAFHLHQHAGAEQQSDASQHLVAHAEQLPEGVDAAQRIDHALIEKVAPGRDAKTGAEQVRRQELGVAQRLYTWPSMSWIMKRPTRVPASTAVRMNSASNRMAK